MPGFSFNPIDYVLAVVCLLLAIVSGAYWIQGKEFELTKARFDTFVAEAKVLGVEADSKGRLKNLKYQTLKKETDHEINLARNSLLAFADFMRKSAKSTGGSILPTPAPSAGNPERTDYDRSYLTRTFNEYDAEMEGIEGEVTEQLIEGATAESGLNGAKRWAQKIEQERHSN